MSYITQFADPDILPFPVSRLEKTATNPVPTRSIFGVKKPIEIFRRFGLTPIPPYLKNTPLGEKALREKYQTVFGLPVGCSF